MRYDPLLQLRGCGDVAEEKLIEQRPGFESRERDVQLKRRVLIGQLDQIGRARIEVDVVGGDLVVVAPGVGLPPDQMGAEAVIAHDDDRCVVPLVPSGQHGSDVIEIDIGQGEIIDIGGTTDGEAVGVAVPDAAGVRNGEVEEQEGVARIGEGGVGGMAELDEVAGVGLALVEIIDARAGGGNNEGRQLPEETDERIGEIRGDAIGRKEIVEVRFAGPEAGAENRGKNAAVGVIPADDGGTVAHGVGVGEDGGALIEGLPSVRSVEEQVAGGGGPHTAEGLSSHEGGDSDFGVAGDGLDVSEDGGFRTETIERREIEAGDAVLVKLAVGQLVENDPEHAAMHLALCGGRYDAGDRVVVEMAGAQAEPYGLKKGKAAKKADGHEDGEAEFPDEAKDPQDDGCRAEGEDDGSDPTQAKEGDTERMREGLSEQCESVAKDGPWEQTENDRPESAVKPQESLRGEKGYEEDHGEKKYVRQRRNKDDRGRAVEMIDRVVPRRVEQSKAVKEDER